MAERSINIALGGRVWTATRARLGGFLRLQQARESLYEGAQEADNGLIVGALYDFLCVAVPDLTPSQFHSAPWLEIFRAYLDIENLNRLPYRDAFSIIHFPSTGKPVPWDHPLRTILIWIHLIAKTYSWAKAEIEELWPEEAIAFVTEIMADEQADREFMHALSQVSYEFNKSTKKSHYRPLARPAWMQMQVSGDIVTKFRRGMMPVGNVVYPADADEGLKPIERE
jgi:hypothetical protein